MDVKALVDLALRIPLHWLIRALVLTSMLLQLLLLLCGALRYRSSSRSLRLVAWISYISADAVAISALGTMMHYARNDMYGIWAPLLLLHLGGPDAITVYSTADNELWLRHLFNMIYHTSVAVYVIYVSAFEGYLLVGAILLLLTGGAKYAERNAALAFASYSRIVNSSQPIYLFMKHEEEIAGEEEHTYLLKGENEIRRELESESDQDTNWKDFLQQGGIVTMKDVWDLEGKRATDDYILCLSYALFKLYKRRFVSLYFHEGVRKKTRKLFFNDHLTCDRVFRMVEMELKFTYDLLFSKSSGTAFSVCGTIIRFLSACFLGFAGFLIFTGLKHRAFKPAQKMVTYTLLSVAFVVELYQLCRIMVSDWTMVWLMCEKVQRTRLRQESFLRRHILKLIEAALFLLRKARKLLGDRYCNNVIQQYSVLDTCFKTRRSCLWRLPAFFVPFYIKVKHIEYAKPDDIKAYIFEKLKALCDPEEEISRCRERVYAYNQCLFRNEGADLQWASELELEEVILAWHIATSICEKRRGVEGLKNIDLSRALSNYCAYLLISHPNLLPLHADIGKMAYMKLHHDAVRNLNDKYADIQNLNSYIGEGTLGRGTKLARKLVRRIPTAEEMWELLAEYWASLLIYIAVYNKANFHAERLTAGGEFVTQLWVLLGHMGCGEQSDSAVTKKVEDKSIREREEEENKRKEQMKRKEEEWRNHQEQKNRQEEKRRRLQERSFL